jgi:signal peptidase I
MGLVAHRRAGLSNSPVAPPTATHGRTAGRWLSPLAALLVLLVAGSVTGLLPVQVMRVDSGSMAPGIGTGDLMVVERVAGPAGRRDVVAVPHPQTGALLVKRVVALGGDQVAIEDGVLVVDGEPVCEPAIDPSRLDGVWFGPVTVPAGEIFLLGDDRGSSIDSRDFGTVPAADVAGLVRVRVWPAPGRLPVDSC